MRQAQVLDASGVLLQGGDVCPGFITAIIGVQGELTVGYVTLHWARRHARRLAVSYLRLAVASAGARLLGLSHAICHALLVCSPPGLFMPPEEEPTRQACSTSNGRAQSGIAGERPDDCPTGGPSGPTRESALLGFTQAGTAADGNRACYKPC